METDRVSHLLTTYGGDDKLFLETVLNVKNVLNIELYKNNVFLLKKKTFGLCIMDNTKHFILKY